MVARDMRVWRTVRLMLVLAVLASGTEARAANRTACIAPEAERAMACEAGPAQAALVRRAAPRLGVPAAETRRKHKPLPPKAPEAVTNATPRDERKLRDIDRQLLLQEIANVTRLLAATPKKHKDRPRLLRRLAESYVELGSAAFRERIEQETLAKEIRRLNPKRHRIVSEKAARAKAVAQRARKHAIRYYRELAAEHPHYWRSPQAKPADRGCRDEVLYYLAFEHEQAGSHDDARKAYLALITDYPRSKYVPNAYLAFGELFFSEAQSDPAKWTPAEQAYREVLDHPAPANKLWGYAQYKLGYVHWNRGEHAPALDGFKKVIELGMRHPELPNTEGLVAAARRDLVAVYALAGDARRAYGFFKPLAGGEAHAREMMAELGLALMDIGHYEQAIVVYRDLLARERGGPASCRYQAQIARATMALHPAGKPEIVAALEKLREAQRAMKRSSHGDAIKTACAQRDGRAGGGDGDGLAPRGGGLGRGAGHREPRDAGGRGDPLRLGKALDAVGEALHFFAARERAKADAIAFPEYRGSGDRADVERFVSTRVKSWIERKVPAIKRATQAYLEVIALNDPAPPPRWAIAAGSAIGAMWGQLVEDFVTAPYPKEWDRPGEIPGSQPPTLWHELRAAYKARLAKEVEPYKKVAKHHFEECLEFGILYQHFDDELKRCEVWLSSRYPNEYHLVDELHAGPTPAVRAQRARPLDAAGRPLPHAMP